MKAARLMAWGLVGTLALSRSAWALGPLEKDHPLVEKGREAYTAGRYDEALSSFEEAGKQKPNDVAVEFNRADALAKLGRVEEAQAAFQRVAEAQHRPDLQQKAHYNLGNLYATTGKRQEALQEYRRALKMDPNDAQARHNYEVVLRNLPPPQKGGTDGGTDGGDGGSGSDGGQDGGRPDAGPDGGQKGDGGTPVDGGTDGGDGGSDAGMDGGADGGADGGGDGGQGDGGNGDGGQGDAGSDGGQKGDQQKGDGGADGGQGDGGESEGEPQAGDGGMDAGTEGEEHSRDGGMSAEDIDKQEAERLLDAMKQNEKNLQLWRFQQKKRPRKPNEKDW